MSERHDASEKLALRYSCRPRRGILFGNVISTLLAILNLVCALAGYSFLAYTMARLHWSGRGIFLVLLAIFICAQIWLIPHLVSAFVFKLTHLLYWIWFADWLVCSFSIVLLWQTLKGICADRPDSAQLDGCGAFGIYWHVVLPLVRPTLLIISLLTLMASAADFIAREVENLQRQAILLMTSYSTMIVSSAIVTLPLFAIFFLAKKLLPPSRGGAFQTAEE